MWLYPSTEPDKPLPPAGGRIDGVIAQGTIAELVAAMRDGDAYVNLHTSDGVDPRDTVSGDFPGGEIRANIDATD